MIYDELINYRSSTERSESYITRLLFGLLGSLGLLVIALNVPLPSTTPSTGWTTLRAAERISIQEIRSDDPTSETAQTPEEDPPPTDHQFTSVESSQNPSGEGSTQDHTSDGRANGDTTMAPVEPAALTTEDTYPNIVGGPGALYLNIDYPREAIREKIEGRLKLSFTVTKEGDVRRIRVTESLHPLCDSAAVEGLRSVKFQPATRDGEHVPVRMSLPIRFRLQPNSDLPLHSTRKSSEG